MGKFEYFFNVIYWYPVLIHIIQSKVEYFEIVYTGDRSLIVQCKCYKQWNLSNPTHQGNREMCLIVQNVVIHVLMFYFS